MIPETYVTDNFEIVKQPSKTYKMEIEKERISIEKIDELHAYNQMIYKCLNTEKGIYSIYPNFGIQKRDLFGKPKDLAFIKLTRRIEDALLLDDRTVKVYNFEYLANLSNDDKLGMKFTVESIFGISEIKEVLEINGI